MPARSRRTTHPAGPIERVVSWFVLLALVLIAAGLWTLQSRPNPALIPGASSPPAVAVAAEGWLNAIPVDFSPMGPPERFNAQTVSDKIDGKAELYLSAGFVSLTTRRMAGRERASEWFEVYVFEMESPRAAFAVYSAQRRPGARALPAPAEGYVAGNGVFALRGRHYVELIAADLASAPAAEAFAAALLDKLPAEKAALSERDFFPPDRLVADSVGLIAESAFGFDRLNQVMTARLRAGAGEVTAFVASRATPEEARALAQAYEAFLLANGGQGRPAPAGLAGTVGVDLYGALEVVIARGNVVAGIHEADDAESGWAAAQALGARLGEMLPP